MRSARPRLAVALAALSIAAAAPVADVHASDQGPHLQAVAAKTCPAGYTKAKMPNGTKCLHAGEFCSRKRKFQRRYHHYGYHCKPNHHLRKR